MKTKPATEFYHIKIPNNERWAIVNDVLIDTYLAGMKAGREIRWTAYTGGWIVAFAFGASAAMLVVWINR